MRTPPTAGRRDRKREATRAAVIAATRELISQHGVVNFRIGDVTEQADIGLGTFYSHFETKDAVIEAVLEDVFRDLADAIGDVSDLIEDPAVALSVGVRRLIGMAYTDPELPRLLVSLEDSGVRFEQMVWERSHRVLARGGETGRFTYGDVDLTLRVAIASVLAAFRTILQDPENGTVAEEIVIILLRAVGLGRDEATEVAHCPMPPIPNAAT